MHDLRHHDLAPLVSLLARLGPSVVAFSGGVDSTLLLAAARMVPDRVFPAATAATEFTASRDLAQARDKALFLGAAQVLVPVRVLADSEVAANPPDRCYHCKRLIFSTLARRFPGRLLLDGTNADDDPARPGLRALAELQVRSPLKDCGLAKAEVRRLSAALGLPGHGQPSNSCLATRLTPGEPITRADLDRVEGMEEALHALGLGDIRARSLGGSLRVEVRAQDLPLAAARLPLIRATARDLGFQTVHISERNA